MPRRRRPHPAHRARRAAGMIALGTYATLLATVGWAQRTSQAETSSPISPPVDGQPVPTGVERLNLSATAIFQPVNTTAPRPAVTSPGPIPIPPPPPSIAVTTTVAPRATTPPAAVAPTIPPLVTSAPPPTVTPAPTTTPPTTAPPTTAAPAVPPPSTVPPIPTIPTGGS